MTCHLSLSLKLFLKNKNVITIILTVFITLLSFYNSTLIHKIDDSKQKVFEKIVKLGAINSSYAGNLSYINLLLSNIQDCRTAKNLGNDLLEKICSAIQNSYEREIAREGEFINSIEETQKEFNLAQKEHLLIETQNRFLVFLASSLFYIFSAIIIIINVVRFKNKNDTKKSK
jgi:hypothetical protein